MYLQDAVNSSMSQKSFQWLHKENDKEKQWGRKDSISSSCETMSSSYTRRESRAQVSPFLSEGLMISLKWGAHNFSLFFDSLSLASSTDNLNLPALPSVLHWTLWTLSPCFSAQETSVHHGGFPSVARHLRGRAWNIQPGNPRLFSNPVFSYSLVPSNNMTSPLTLPSRSAKVFQTPYPFIFPNWASQNYTAFVKTHYGSEL